MTQIKKKKFKKKRLNQKKRVTSSPELLNLDDSIYMNCGEDVSLLFSLSLQNRLLTHTLSCSFTALNKNEDEQKHKKKKERKQESKKARKTER